jgi:hypothetical protein
MPRFIICFFFVLVSFASASEEVEVLVIPPGNDNTITRQTAMPEMGESRLGEILDRYFNEGLGGLENWERVESLYIEGWFQLEDREVDISVYQKKPDFIKLTLRQESGVFMVLGYDGEVAWRKQGAQAEPKPMDEDQARRFAHSAKFGNHLLYPFAHGKTISYIDTVPVEGAICHQIRVDLDTNFRVDYFIDIRNFREIKVENTDLSTGLRNSVVYRDYVVESGMAVAKRVDSYEEGEWISTLKVEEIRINSGVMPWMFHMPE